MLYLKIIIVPISQFRCIIIILTDIHKCTYPSNPLW